MAYVCKEWFPKGTYKGQQEDGFWMDDYLKYQLDILIKNITKDWNYTIIISAGGEMRVGKSVLAMQIGSYWSYEIWKRYGIKVPYSVSENIAFSGKEIMDKGDRLGSRHKYSALVMDEAADDLESTKVLKQETRAIKDYLRKSAQYNMLNIVVQAEFFEIPKAIAISRTIFLIDVDYNIDEDGYFRRGVFKFYSRRNKKQLFLKGKRDLNYNAWKPDFRGSFINFYPIDEQEYREGKAKSLRDFKKLTALELKRIEWLKACLKMLYQSITSHRELADAINEISKYKIHYNTIGKYLKGEKVDEDEDEEKY